MKVSPNNILPSQDFLKPDTIVYILNCYKTGALENLPPDPIIREDETGNFIAIDGHNLIAVKLYRGEKIEVHLARHPDDGLPPTLGANRKRNADLKEKFESVLQDRARVEAEGIESFQDLIERYSESFHQ